MFTTITEVKIITGKIVKADLVQRAQYAIEAYINNYDGYTGQGDILSKFGVSLKDELSLVISKERFEDFISPFLWYSIISL